MATVVVPYRSDGKRRLPEDVRREIALAMLGDVLEAAASFAPTVVVTDDLAAGRLAADLQVHLVADPGGGQAAAVETALEGLDGVCVVVNADCPKVRVSDLAALADTARRGRLALVEARDGTTNALGLPVAAAFAPLYGRESARQFRAHANALGLGFEQLDLGRIVDDVDTLADFARVAPNAGVRTQELGARLLGGSA